MFDIEIGMYLLFVLLASLIYQIIIIYYRTKTQTEAIHLSNSLKRKQINQVFGYRTFQFKPVMNQPNTNEQEPLPGGRGQILHTLSIRGVGRGTILGRGYAFGRGAVGHLPPGGGD